MKEQDIDEDGREQNQTDRDKAAYKNKQASDDHEHRGEVHNVVGRQDRQVGECVARRHGRLRHEVQDAVETEDQEHEAEEDASRDDGVFHRLELPGSRMLSRLSIADRI